MLENYLKMLSDLEEDLAIDARAHDDEVITSAYIERAIDAVQFLKTYIDNMNQEFNQKVRTMKMTEEEREYIDQAITDIYDLAEKVKEGTITQNDLYTQLIALVHENLGGLVQPPIQRRK